MTDTIHPFTDDADYERWYRDHPGGYVLNIKPNEVVLHRVPCSHIARRSTRPHKRLTTSSKVCSTNRTVIDEHAPTYGLPVRRCPDC